MHSDALSEVVGCIWSIRLHCITHWKNKHHQFSHITLEDDISSLNFHFCTSWFSTLRRLVAIDSVVISMPFQIMCFPLMVSTDCITTYSMRSMSVHSMHTVMHMIRVWRRTWVSAVNVAEATFWKVIYCKIPGSLDKGIYYECPDTWFPEPVCQF